MTDSVLDYLWDSVDGAIVYTSPVNKYEILFLRSKFLMDTKCIYTVCWSLLFESLKFMVSLFLNSHSPFFFKNNNRVIKYKVAAPSFKPAFLYRIYTVYICMPFLGGASSLTSFLIPLL